MIKPIPNWKKAWKFASVQFSVLGLFLVGLSDIFREVWNQLPPEFQINVPHASTIALVTMALSLVGRLFVLTGSKTNEGSTADQ